MWTIFKKTKQSVRNLSIWAAITATMLYIIVLHVEDEWLTVKTTSSRDYRDTYNSPKTIAWPNSSTMVRYITPSTLDGEIQLVRNQEFCERCQMGMQFYARFRVSASLRSFTIKEAHLSIIKFITHPTQYSFLVPKINER